MVVPEKPSKKPMVFRFIKDIAKKTQKPAYDSKKGVEDVKKYEINVADKEPFEATYYNLFDKLAGVGEFNVWKEKDVFRYSLGSQSWTASRNNQRAQIQQAASLLQAVNDVSKILLGMYKDLGRINEALGYYDSSKTPSELVLKALWADMVDSKKGLASLHQMATGNLQMLMLRDYFYHVEGNTDEEIEKNVDEIDTTPRIKTVLKRKLKEYADWRKRWKEELKKAKPLLEERVASQEETLNMYKEWARPIIKDVQNLMYQVQHEGGEHLDPRLIEIGQSVFSNVAMLAWKGYKDPSDKDWETFKSLFPKEGKFWKDWVPAAGFIIKKELSDFGWYVPVIEVSFDFGGSTVMGANVFDTTITMNLRIYDLPSFIKRREELKEDKADKWFKKVLAPVTSAKNSAENKKPESKKESLEGLKKNVEGIQEFFKKFTKDYAKNPDLRIMAIDKLKESGFTVYEKFKKAQGQLTWGDRWPW